MTKSGNLFFSGQIAGLVPQKGVGRVTARYTRDVGVAAIAICAGSNKVVDVAGKDYCGGPVGPVLMIPDLPVFLVGVAASGRLPALPHRPGFSLRVRRTLSDGQPGAS